MANSVVAALMLVLHRGILIRFLRSFWRFPRLSSTCMQQLFTTSKFFNSLESKFPVPRQPLYLKRPSDFNSVITAVDGFDLVFRRDKSFTCPKDAHLACLPIFERYFIPEAAPIFLLLEQSLDLAEIDYPCL